MTCEKSIPAVASTESVAYGCGMTKLTKAAKRARIVAPTVPAEARAEVLKRATSRVTAKASVKTVGVRGRSAA